MVPTKQIISENMTLIDQAAKKLHSHLTVVCNGLLMFNLLFLNFLVIVTL